MTSIRPHQYKVDIAIQALELIKLEDLYRIRSRDGRGKARAYHGTSNR